MTGRAIVGVIGAGASGTLVAAHLAATADVAREIDILLIDPDEPGRGVAFSTTDPRHRLNVPAKGMSAWPDDPGHFVRWLRRHVSEQTAEGAFAPRQDYARYLADVLDVAVANSPNVGVQHIAQRVVDVRVDGAEYLISFADGTTRLVDAVVLALGNGSPSARWAPTALRESDRFVADPWRADVASRVRPGDDVVLVGAGLSAGDMARSLADDGVRVHMVSRHGMLPLPHARQPQPPLPLGDRTLPTSLAEARRFVFRAVRDAEGDWRRAVDGLRPVTQQIWRGLDDASRRQLLGGAVRWWDRVRHRVDPDMYDWLEQRRREGSLIVHRACIVGARGGGDRVELSLSDGTGISASIVLNCTGTCVGVDSGADPLLLNLLATGLVVAGPLELGVATDDRGRVLPSRSTPGAVWAIGPLRRGELWESTAVPEIRVQAADVARQVLEHVAVPALIG